MWQTTDSIQPKSSRSDCGRRKAVATGRTRSVGGLRLRRCPGTSKLLLSSWYVTYRLSACHHRAQNELGMGQKTNRPCIPVGGKSSHYPCSESQPYAPFVEAKSLIQVPHNAGNQFQDASLTHRIVCNSCMMVWAQGGGMGCRGGTAETPALHTPTVTHTFHRVKKDAKSGLKSIIFGHPRIVC
jgi:hypothetical protein